MVSNLLVLSLLILFPSHCFVAPAYQRLSVPADDATKPALAYGEQIARYTFDGDASDSMGRNSDIHLRKTGFINGSLYLNGVYLFATAEVPGYFAAAEIRDLDPQSFTI